MNKISKKLDIYAVNPTVSGRIILKKMSISITRSWIYRFSFPRSITRAHINVSEIGFAPEKIPKRKEGRGQTKVNTASGRAKAFSEYSLNTFRVKHGGLRDYTIPNYSTLQLWRLRWYKRAADPSARINWLIRPVSTLRNLALQEASCNSVYTHPKASYTIFGPLKLTWSFFIGFRREISAYFRV